MPGSDSYSSSAPPLGFDPSALKPSSNAVQQTRDATIKNLTDKILMQNTYDKWTGQGFGTVYENAKQMASRLYDNGITRLEDFGKRIERSDDGTFSYGYYNKATGKSIPDSFTFNDDGSWYKTYAGDGSTVFKVSFDQMGMPYFYTQYGGSSSSWGDFAPIFALASVIPSPIQPFAQAINAASAIRQGNTIGGILGALGAAYSFGQLLPVLLIEPCPSLALECHVFAVGL